MKCPHKNSQGRNTVINYHSICLRCSKRGYESTWRVLHIDGFESVLIGETRVTGGTGRHYDWMNLDDLVGECAAPARMQARIGGIAAAYNIPEERLEIR